ncbi:MAG: undecaprenyldiphospho-muramoylpentapeptide beta-N-acetylglucosaminyltransferase, partial [Clostridiales bacterium]
GHIYPALSIAHALQAEGAQILFMGGMKTPDGKGEAVESHLAQQAGFEYRGVSAAGLHFKSIALLKDLLINFKGMQEARGYIEKFKPDLVIGCGGYAAAPVLRAAQSLAIPTLIHEQNAYPGRANRYLAKRAKAVCQTFAASAALFPPKSKLFLTGLPVRKSIFNATRLDAWRYFCLDGAEQNIPTLLICGGSQGAQAINQAAVAAYGALLAMGIRIIHLCGERNYEDLLAQAPHHPRLMLLPYLDHMEYALTLADLTLSRAGASYLAEIACVGLPAILIPYPYAAGDHQTANAKAVESAGAAVVIGNDQLTGELLAETVSSLLTNPVRLARMAEAAKTLAKPDAAAHICSIAKQIIK